MLKGVNICILYHYNITFVTDHCGEGWQYTFPGQWVGDEYPERLEF
jgi:hypothetical protein